MYLERGFISELPPSGLIQDDYVDRSTYVVAVQGDEIVGGVRLISGPASELPTLNEFEPDSIWLPYLERLGPEQIAEVSALAIDHDSQQENFAISTGLYRAMLRHCLEDTKISVWIGAVEVPLLRILHKVFGIPLWVIAEPHWWIEAVRAPLLIDLWRYMLTAKDTDPAAFEYFTEGLVIDLRDREAIIDVRESNGAVARLEAALAETEDAPSA